MTKNPFDNVFDEMAKLMKFAYQNVHKPVPPEKEWEFHKKLDELEKQVAEFKKKNEELIAGMGISAYQAETVLGDKKELEKFTEQQRDTLKQAETLKDEALTAAEDIQKAAKQAEIRASEKGKNVTCLLYPHGHSLRYQSARF